MKNTAECGQSPLEKKFTNIITPFQKFMHNQVTASVILIICTVIALILSNSSYATWYNGLFETSAGFIFEDWKFQKTIHHWINDGLMAIFFFILGLEIKREILVGDLRTPARAIPVMTAAVGGMIFPALIYIVFNSAGSSADGWGIPMATDTAFAVGILALLHKHVPNSLVSFLAALAIIDDIGAILVIALFYTASIDTSYLLFAFTMPGLLIIFNIFGINRPSAYLLVGAIVWYAMLKSGIHATIAGILVAMTIPARPKKDRQWFISRTRKLLEQIDKMEKRKPSPTPVLAEEEQHAVLENVEESAKKSTTPLQRWESGLEHHVSLFVLPVFALANAGVMISKDSLFNIFIEPVSIGILMGLVFGKSIGITLFGWLALKAGWGDLPGKMTVHHLVGVSLLGGIGFTMSIFITNLSFSHDPETILAAKSSVLMASLISGLSGYLWLRLKQ